MNADDAKRLHLPGIIEAAGGKRDESRSRGGDEWYFSPFREEKTASLKAARGRNGNWMWTDYGTGKGGNVIAFANVVLGREPDDRGIRDSLKWLRGLAAHQTVELPRREPRKEPAKAQERSEGPRYTITGRKHLMHRRNLDYIKWRGVNGAIAAKYLQEITFTDNERGRQLYGLGMENEAGGVEITTASEQPFKTCIGPKSFTKITPTGRRHDSGGHNRHVFEGMFDFLTYLTLHGREDPLGIAYVLHSVAMVDQVRQDLMKVEGGGAVVLWLDNDQAGEDAAQRLFTGLSDWTGGVATMNHLYEGYKDLNDWYRETRPGVMTGAAPKVYDDTAWAMVRARPSSAKPGGPT